MSFQMAPYVAELLEDAAGDLGLHREDVLQAVWPRLTGICPAPFCSASRGSGGVILHCVQCWGMSLSSPTVDL